MAVQDGSTNGRRGERTATAHHCLALHLGVVRGTTRRLAGGRVPAEHRVAAPQATGEDHFRALAFLRLVYRTRRAAKLAEAAARRDRRSFGQERAWHVHGDNLFDPPRRAYQPGSSYVGMIIEEVGARLVVGKRTHARA